MPVFQTINWFCLILDNSINNILKNISHFSFRWPFLLLINASFEFWGLNNATVLIIITSFCEASAAIFICLLMYKWFQAMRWKVELEWDGEEFWSPMCLGVTVEGNFSLWRPGACWESPQPPNSGLFSCVRQIDLIEMSQQVSALSPSLPS